MLFHQPLVVLSFIGIPPFRFFGFQPPREWMRVLGLHFRLEMLTFGGRHGQRGNAFRFVNTAVF